MDAKNIKYFYCAEEGIELILCEGSSIQYPTHNHISSVTIGIVLDGSIFVTENKTVKRYEKNQSFVVLPYTPHSISAKGKYTLLSLCINTKKLKIQSYDILKTNIINILNKALDNDKLSYCKINLLWDCLRLCIDMQITDNAETSAISTIKKQLEMYPENNVSIDKMANNAYVNKYHFIRIFKSEVGLTPHQFQIQNRIRKAKHLINNTNTITEAALTAGFCDQSHFIRQFEKHLGITPSDYKSSFSIIKLDTYD